ncbi:MAG: DUF3299 domain-containing protein [Thiolinea sp.]
MSVSQRYFFISLMVLSLAACQEQAADDTPSSASETSITADAPGSTIKTLDWIDLLPANIDREALIERYADLVIQRLDQVDDRSLQATIINEFNQAPSNPNLDGLNIRLAGYMIVLDDRDGRINEFLLVPYSGAGVHQPAPPANQMILVRPEPEQALAASEQYAAVWVEGILKVQTSSTSVAQTAYLLEHAQIRLYTAEDAKQTELLQKQPEHTNEHARD